MRGAFYKMPPPPNTHKHNFSRTHSCEGKLLKERFHRKLNKEEKRISEYEPEEIA